MCIEPAPDSTCHMPIDRSVDPGNERLDIGELLWKAATTWCRATGVMCELPMGLDCGARILAVSEWRVIRTKLPTSLQTSRQ